MPVCLRTVTINNLVVKDRGMSPHQQPLGTAKVPDSYASAYMLYFLLAGSVVFLC